MPDDQTPAPPAPEADAGPKKPKLTLAMLEQRVMALEHCNGIRSPDDDASDEA